MSELLYCTLNKYSQFSMLPLLMWLESPSPATEGIFGSICGSPVFELDRCSLLWWHGQIFSLWVIGFWKQKRVVWN